MIRSYERGALKAINDVTLVPGVLVRHLRPDVKLGKDVTFAESGTGVVFAVIGDECHVLWSEIPDVEKDLDLFKQFAMPLTRRVFPQMIANQLVSIQPMVMPSSKSFYLDYTYGQSSGSINV